MNDAEDTLLQYIRTFRFPSSVGKEHTAVVETLAARKLVRVVAVEPFFLIVEPICEEVEHKFNRMMAI